jgi:AcrR family transcriptional regulator
MPQPAQQRADALKNREVILRAAHDALAESPNASLNSIAKRAGVGPGTLYRHFPTREALIVELYHHEIQKIIDLAHTLAADLPPLDALRRWFEVLAHYGRFKYGVSEVIHAATNGGLDDKNYEPFLQAIAALLDAGVASQELKPGIDPQDVLLQLSVLWRIPPSDDAAARAARLLDLILDGLRTRPPEPEARPPRPRPAGRPHPGLGRSLPRS